MEIHEKFRHFYRAPTSGNWEGRNSNPEWPNQYFHEVVQVLHVEDLLKDPDITKGLKVALVGYACDEGTRRNSGRVGAEEGPQNIRSHLGKLTIHFDSCQIWDLGDIICVSGDMETSQAFLSDLVKVLKAHSTFPIVLGGSHDLSYGHVMGLIDGMSGGTKHKIGMINFDAHFDLREKNIEGNSGTPFFQLLDEKADVLSYCVVGIQQSSNTPELFAMANKLGVNYISQTDCLDQPHMVEERVMSFVEQHDHIYVSIDMDGFSSAFAPGVSAPSPLGMLPHRVIRLLSSIISTKKVVSCDIAELNPTYDLGGQTASLAARLINHIIYELTAQAFKSGS